MTQFLRGGDKELEGLTSPTTIAGFLLMGVLLLWNSYLEFDYRYIFTVAEGGAYLVILLLAMSLLGLSIYTIYKGILTSAILQMAVALVALCDVVPYFLGYSVGNEADLAFIIYLPISLMYLNRGDNYLGLAATALFLGISLHLLDGSESLAGLSSILTYMIPGGMFVIYAWAVIIYMDTGIRIGHFNILSKSDIHGRAENSSEVCLVMLPLLMGVMILISVVNNILGDFDGGTAVLLTFLSAILLILSACAILGNLPGLAVTSITISLMFLLQGVTYLLYDTEVFGVPAIAQGLVLSLIGGISCCRDRLFGILMVLCGLGLSVAGLFGFGIVPALLMLPAAVFLIYVGFVYWLKVEFRFSTSPIKVWKP